MTRFVTLLACLGIHLSVVTFSVFPFVVSLFGCATHSGPRRYSIMTGRASVGVSVLRLHTANEYSR